MNLFEFDKHYAAMLALRSGMAEWLNSIILW